MHAILRSTVVLAALALGAAAPAPDLTAPLTPAQERAVIDNAVKLIGQNYVLADKRAAIVAELRRREAAGRYAIDNPAAFAQTLSDDLVEISQDRHMWFTLDPEGYKAALLPHDDNHNDPISDAAFVRNNQGYTEMRILPGEMPILPDAPAMVSREKSTQVWCWHSAARRLRSSWST